VLGLWTLTVALGLANAVLTTLAWDDLTATDEYTNLFGSVASVFYATLGVLVVMRAGNRIGWLLLTVAVTFVSVCLLSSYAVVAVLTRPGVLPAGRAVGTVAEWLFVPLVVVMAFMLLLFPTGSLPSVNWRPVAAIALAVALLEGMLFVVAPRSVGLPAPGGVSLVFENPFALDSLGSVGRMLGSIDALAVVNLALLALALVALVVRFRRGRGDVRRQILWVALVAGAGLVLQGVASGAQLACGCAQTPVTSAALLAQGVVALIGVPLAITIAILKYGLYQIDRILNRALVYGALTITLAAVYLASVLLLQLLLNPITTQSGVAVAGSTLAAAALFRPARLRIQALVDRRFYRTRYDANRTLDAFATQLRHEVDLNDMAHDLQSAVNVTWQPAHVSVWLRS
jgi:hypothetical protein